MVVGGGLFVVFFGGVGVISFCLTLFSPCAGGVSLTFFSRPCCAYYFSLFFKKKEKKKKNPPGVGARAPHGCLAFPALAGLV